MTSPLSMALLRTTLAGMVIVLLGTTAPATELHVDEDSDNQVTFISDAPVEDFEGVTDRIDGYVYWEGDSLVAGADYPNSQVYFEVLLESLDTGIGMRNEDMREDFLETDQHPYATYKAGIVEVRQQTDTTYLVVADGQLTIHGETNQVRTQNNVTVTGPRYHVETAFNVQLPDYNIDVPELLFLRIAETIKLQLNFWLKPAPK